MDGIASFDDVNRDLWNRWTPIHAASPFFDVDGFRRGSNTLKEPEREALGDVRGKSILHLQCGLGLDSLSLARQGASVTGVDYADASIGFACQLAEESGLSARFICSNVYALPELLDQSYDVVLASYGVVHWLHDLGRFNRIVSHFLVDDGFLFLVDFHPLFNMLDGEGRGFTFPYFAADGPVRTVKKGACVDPAADVEHPAYEWPHSMQEIVMAAIDAGLRLVDFREYPYMPFDRLSYLKSIGAGRYAAMRNGFPLPLMFSLKAVKQRDRAKRSQ